MNDQWQELKETIIEMRDNNGTGTQQEVCKFLANLMEILEKQMQEPKTGHWIEDDMTYCGVDLTNYKCDKCGEIGGSWRKGLKPDKLPKYCMNCGAKMEGESEDT